MEDIHISEQLKHLSFDTGVNHEDAIHPKAEEQNEAFDVEYLFRDSFIGIRTAVTEPQSTGEYQIEKGFKHNEDNLEEVEQSGTYIDKGSQKISWEKTSHNQKGKLKLSEYSMTAKPRGIAVIIAIEKFDTLQRLVGVPFDIDRCKKAFETLHFKVEICEKLEAKEIINFVEEIANRNHSMYDCFILYVSSHGGQGFICCSDFKKENKVETEDKLAQNDNNNKEKENGYIFFDTLLNIFLSPNTCGTLGGKPKLFFLDCCRGTEYEISKGRNESPLRKFENKKAKHEYFADIFIGYATLSGDTAGMNSTGSAYTQILTDHMIELFPKESFVEVMTAVTEATKESCKQMPEQNHTLCKRILMKEPVRC